MYFASRMQAGRLLAADIVKKYRYENCAVVALNDGGVMVGAQIAMQLHCVLTMLLSEEITLPRESVALGGIDQNGAFSYNPDFTKGEIDEMASEYFQYIEQEKFNKMHQINRLIGQGGLISRDLLKAHNIILVSDGLPSSFPLLMAQQYIKPIAIEKLIVATPLASVKTVDWMHISADDIYCLNVPADYMDTAHYYDKQDIPDHDMVIETIEKIILNWK
jgi:putative phosphoribosyl transferase